LNIAEVINEATRRGLRLERRGEFLAVRPKGACPPDFADVLRAHKAGILSLLEGRAAGLAPDCQPWLHVAKQVLAGEFEGADDSTVTSLVIGLRSIGHPVCKRAVEQLTRQQEKTTQ
jgi:hypothetical protein